MVRYGSFPKRWPVLINIFQCLSGGTFLAQLLLKMSLPELTGLRPAFLPANQASISNAGRNGSPHTTLTWRTQDVRENSEANKR